MLRNIRIFFPFFNSIKVHVEKLKINLKFSLNAKTLANRTTKA